MDVLEKAKEIAEDWRNGESYVDEAVLYRTLVELIQELNTVNQSSYNVLP